MDNTNLIDECEGIKVLERTYFGNADSNLMEDKDEVIIAGRLRDNFDVIMKDNFKIHKVSLIRKKSSGVEEVFELHIKEDTYRTMKAFAYNDIEEDVFVNGTLRTYKCENGMSKTVILVYSVERACEIDGFVREDGIDNFVRLIGTLISVRKATSKRGDTICEARIQVDGRYGKMSRIVAVAWDRNAAKILDLAIGTRLDIVGRAQTRSVHCNKGSIENTTEVAIIYFNILQQAKEETC